MSQIDGLFDRRSLSSVFKLDYHELAKIAQNVEAFDACGKMTHGIFICARALTKKNIQHLKDYPIKRVIWSLRLTLPISPSYFRESLI